MNKVIHRSDQRGHADHGWLRTYHSFSFADYFDYNRMNFGMLRVLNDDIVAPGKGFGMHPHDNMEIITIVLSGALEHKDSMGNTGVIKPGEIQIMSAGSGIYHSEYNHSREEEVSVLQIWVIPDKKNVEPRYGRAYYDSTNINNNLHLIVSPEKNDGSAWIYRQSWFSLGEFDKDRSVSYKLRKKDNGVYIFVINGKLNIAGEVIGERDAIGLTGFDEAAITFPDKSRILLIEVPMK